ncbi:MAG TPA: DegV family protein [Candidatus Eisenbacteria bacterium]|nr:DegV family protein [Candidatus Eisenbacteria bacterium]
MSNVAIVTDSASDYDPGRARDLGIAVVPLIVNFGAESFEANVDLSTEDFWKKMTAPGAPFPTTAATSPGVFRAAYERLFDEGADAIVSIHVAGTLSATIKSAEIARTSLPDREIHIVDSMSASMAEGILAELGVQMAAEGRSAAEIVTALEGRRDDLAIYLALDTLTYLKRGGRISGAQAAVGTLLSVKPIISVPKGVVETVDRVRTRGKARERLVELLCSRPIERLALLHTTNADIESFAEEVVGRVPGGIDRSKVSVDLVGPSVGPHLGPGCVGGVALYQQG